MSVLTPSIDAGGGRIASLIHGSEVVFSELSATYPLKLLSPRIVQAGVGLVYVLSYGGGLVGGDRVQLSVDVGTGTTLVLLSQVSMPGLLTRSGAERELGVHESIQDATGRPSRGTS